VFRGLQGEFKDLVTSLVTKVEPLSYADLHSHPLMHELLHKMSFPSMRSVFINAPLLPTPNTPLQPLSLNASPLEILVATGAVSIEDGVPTSLAVEGTSLLHPDQIFIASITPPIVATNKAIGREIGSATGGRIHAANCAKHSAIQPFTVLHFSTEAMDNNLVQIWR